MKKRFLKIKKIKRLLILNFKKIIYIKKEVIEFFEIIKYFVV